MMRDGEIDDVDDNDQTFKFDPFQSSIRRAYFIYALIFICLIVHLALPLQFQY